jgi:predicted secreted protein
MNIADDQDIVLATTVSAPRKRRRWLRAVLLIFTAQYTITTIMVGASVAATLRYLVTPQIVAQFEAISAALRR